MLYIIKKIFKDTVLCTDEMGFIHSFPIANFPLGIFEGVPVVRWRDGSFTRYNGDFEDEDGQWWHLVQDIDSHHLEKRRAPLSDAEIKVFVGRLNETNDPSLFPILDITIDDQLRSGRIEDAYPLMLLREWPITPQE